MVLSQGTEIPNLIKIIRSKGKQPYQKKPTDNEQEELTGVYAVSQNKPNSV
jgi:hypothetical protein